MWGELSENNCSFESQPGVLLMYMYYMLPGAISSERNHLSFQTVSVFRQGTSHIAISR